MKLVSLSACFVSAKPTDPPGSGRKMQLSRAKLPCDGQAGPDRRPDWAGRKLQHRLSEDRSPETKIAFCGLTPLIGLQESTAEIVMTRLAQASPSRPRCKPVLRACLHVILAGAGRPDARVVEFDDAGQLHQVQLAVARTGVGGRQSTPNPYLFGAIRPRKHQPF